MLLQFKFENILELIEKKDKKKGKCDCD